MKYLVLTHPSVDYAKAMALYCLKGTLSACKAYNDHIAHQMALPIGRFVRWASPIERNGNHYIRKHPDYPATAGLTPANLPEPETDTEGNI